MISHPTKIRVIHAPAAKMEVEFIPDKHAPRFQYFIVPPEEQYTLGQTDQQIIQERNDLKVRCQQLEEKLAMIEEVLYPDQDDGDYDE